MEGQSPYAVAVVLLIVAIASTLTLLVVHQFEAGSKVELRLGPGKVLVMFRSLACEACEKVLPYWRKAVQMAKGVELVDVVVEESPLLAARYNVRETPTFLLFIDGRLVARHEGPFGYNEEEFLANLFEWVRERSSASELDLKDVVVLPSFILLGLSTFASPCVLPIALGLISLMVSRGGRITAAGCSLCAILAAVGILTIGVVVGVLGAVAAAILPIVTKVFAFLLFSIGLASILELPMGVPRGLGRGKGFYSLCLSFGVMSIQCSLPLVVGSLIAIASSYNVWFNLAKLALFSLGFVAPLGVTVFLTSRGVVNTQRLKEKLPLFHKVGGLVLIGLGIALLL